MFFFIVRVIKSADRNEMKIELVVSDVSAFSKKTSYNILEIQKRKNIFFKN